MKTLLILFLPLLLSAFDNITAGKIFDKIFQAMIDKPQVKIYSSNDIYKKVVITASSLTLTESCKDADIILVDSMKEIPKECEEKMFFTTSNRVFKNFDNAVGAFYWDRGHIRIKFLQSRLDNYNLKLPDTFNKYIEEERM